MKKKMFELPPPSNKYHALNEWPLNPTGLVSNTKITVGLTSQIGSSMIGSSWSSENSRTHGETPSRNLAPVKNEAAADRCQLEFSVGFSNMLLMVQKSVEL